MQVIGFHFTKVFAEKYEDKVTAKPTTSIEFIDLEKDNVDFLKDSEALKIKFKYVLSYEESAKKNKSQGEISFEGKIIISASKEESKEITNHWKNKKLPTHINLNLFNLILKRCTPKAIAFQDEISLPFHTPMPKLGPKAISS